MLGLDNILYFSKDLLNPSEEFQRSGDTFNNGAQNRSIFANDGEIAQKSLGLSDQDLLVIQSKMNNIIER